MQHLSLELEIEIYDLEGRFEVSWMTDTLTKHACMVGLL